MFQDAIDWFCAENDIRWEGCEFHYFPTKSAALRAASTAKGLRQELFEYIAQKQDKAGGCFVDADIYGMGAFVFLFQENSTLFHELVHYRQYKRRELIALAPFRTQWKGEVVNQELIPYFERPWEIEALDEQEDWYKKWNGLKKEPTISVKNMVKTPLELQLTD